MDRQPALFHETLTSALAEVVGALGGPKKAGPEMRPELGVEAAASWLRDCLNPERPARLNPDQLQLLLRMGRRVNCHAAMRFLCNEAGYEDPRPTSPAQERSEIMLSMDRMLRETQRLATRLEQLRDE